MQTRIAFKRDLRLRNPILVVGLPGIGSVGRIVVENIRKEYKAEKIAVLYSPHFPSNVMMMKSGGIRLVSNRFYLISQKPRDIVLLTGDFQAASPEGQYEINSRVLNFFKNSLKGDTIYTIGGYLSHSASTTPRVFANATSKAALDGISGNGVVIGKSKGSIWGSAGMLLAFAKMRKVNGVCLLGETSIVDFDAAAAKSVITVLSKILHLKIKTKDIDRMLAETAKATAAMMQQLQSPEEDSSRKLSYIR